MADGTGALIQLLAIGPQDAFVSSSTCGFNPWRAAFKRATRCSLETVDFAFPNRFLFGARNVTEIPMSGDALGGITLEIRLPAIPNAKKGDTWVSKIGYVLLRRVKVMLNETLLSDQERLWYDIEDALLCSSSHKTALDEMIGTAPLSLAEPHTLLVPLKLPWTLKNFFPLVSLPGVRMTLEIETESFMNCISSSLPLVFPRSSRFEEIDVTCLYEFAFLDVDERHSLLQSTIAWEYDAVMDVEAKTYKESVGTDGSSSRVTCTTLQIDMSELNYPVRALAWVVYQEVYGSSYFTYEKDAIESAQLYANGQELMLKFPGHYFQLMTKTYRGVNCGGKDGIHFYSFALDISRLRNSGALGFNRAKRPYLLVDMAPEFMASLDGKNAVVKLFAIVRRTVQLRQGAATFLTL